MYSVQQHRVVNTVDAIMVSAVEMVTIIPPILIRVFLPAEGVVQAVEVLAKVYFVHVV